MTAVPEARVVLGVGDERIDLTWPGHLRPVPDFLVEEQIQPRQVGSVEAVWHRRQSDAWAEAGGVASMRAVEGRLKLAGSAGTVDSGVMVSAEWEIAEHTTVDSLYGFKVANVGGTGGTEG